MAKKGKETLLLYVISKTPQIQCKSIFLGCLFIHSKCAASLNLAVLVVRFLSWNSVNYSFQSHKNSNLKVFSQYLLSDAKLWIAFVNLLDVQSRQNKVVIQKLSIVCAESGSRRGIGQFFKCLALPQSKWICYFKVPSCSGRLQKLQIGMVENINIFATIYSRFQKICGQNLLSTPRWEIVFLFACFSLKPKNI